MRRRAFLRRMAFAAIASGMLGSELLWRRRDSDARFVEFTQSVLQDIAAGLGSPYRILVGDHGQ